MDRPTVFGWIIRTTSPVGPYESEAPHFLGPEGATTEVKSAFIYPTAAMALRHRTNANQKVALVRIVDAVYGGITVVRDMKFFTQDTRQLGPAQMNYIHTTAEQISETTIAPGYISRLSSMMLDNNIDVFYNPAGFLRMKTMLMSDQQFGRLFNFVAKDFAGHDMPLTGAADIFYDELTEILLAKVSAGNINTRMVFSGDYPKWAQDGNVIKGYQTAYEIML